MVKGKEEIGNGRLEVWRTREGGRRNTGLRLG